MRYLDSTARAATSALGHWLSQEIPGDHTHLRIKSGYFTLNGLGALKSSIDHLVQNDLPISIALGANDKATIQSDVDALYTLIGCPRPKAKLCVVSCAGGLFHPKVVHLSRADGSQLAYVGSANATPAGFNGTNIEAGILLDSRDGDSTTILAEIAVSIDAWFQVAQAGVTNIASSATTQQLVTAGILGLVKQNLGNTSAGPTGSGQTTPKVPLVPLVSFPSLAASAQSSPPSGGTGQIAATVVQSTSQGVIGPEILVAEIGAGVRWKQANFPYAIMQNYFGVNPTGNGSVNLIPVDASGAPSPPVPTQVVNVKSQNYRLELGSVAGIPYPTNGRPIAVFRRTPSGAFRYRVFFVGDPGYNLLSAGLAKYYSGPAHQLKRIMIVSTILNQICATCPV